MYREGGMTETEALRSATVTAGRLVGRMGENAPVGVIKTGARADLLILDGDPRTDLEIARRPAGVVLGGKPVDLAWVEQTLNELSLVLAEPQE